MISLKSEKEWELKVERHNIIAQPSIGSNMLASAETLQNHGFFSAANS